MYLKRRRGILRNHARLMFTEMNECFVCYGLASIWLSCHFKVCVVLKLIPHLLALSTGNFHQKINLLVKPYLEHGTPQKKMSNEDTG
jgi:hypothetical protein